MSSKSGPEACASEVAACGRYEAGFFSSMFERLPEEARLKLGALLASGDEEDGPSGDGGSGTSWDRRRSVVGWLKADPGRVGLESVLEEVEKLRRVGEVGVPEGLFDGISPKVLKAYRQRAATERPGANYGRIRRRSAPPSSPSSCGTGVRKWFRGPRARLGHE